MADNPEPRRQIIPVLTILGKVLFPGTIVQVTLHHQRQNESVKLALASDRLLMVVANDPVQPEQPFLLGTVGSIIKLLKPPGGETQILVQGLHPARVLDWVGSPVGLKARIENLAQESDLPRSVSVRALCGTVRANLRQLANLGRPIANDVLDLADELEDPERLAHLVAGNLELEVATAQKVLETADPLDKLQLVSRLVGSETELAEAEIEIHNRTRSEFDRSHRKSFLRRQLREIQAELGDGNWIGEELANYRERMAARHPTPEAQEEFDRQLQRLERAHPESIETSLLRNHLDVLASFPWGLSAQETLDLEQAETVLDQHHYGLLDAKLRLLEFLAVRRLNPSAKGPILCLLGPPGVGKTSLGKSVAKATGRSFVQTALGGVHDEAEIRGHRRTYVGAMPGRIVQGLIQAEVDNPVLMLDEIDKLGSDFRGDPTAALLEVLDPEQNHHFRDHFLGVGVDLSKVLFLATANQMETIPPALRDRLEVLPLSGYSPIEKQTIARRHLIPRQINAAGLKKGQARISDAALRTIIKDYTREAGVRDLERALAKIYRKIALATVRGERPGSSISKGKVSVFLGPPRHTSEELLDRPRIGVATGLAWTPSGGDLLIIETAAVQGKGELQLTGSLGEVMRESAQAALTHIRTRDQDQEFIDFFAQHDIHIHVPAGAVPKDGPSAGVTIATAIASLAIGRPVDHRIAMTGELTLRGEVLPVGGIREKLLAAHAAGIGRLMLPTRNQIDVEALEEDWLSELDIHYAETMDQVLAGALQPR